ncbi:MAG: hypothetical protein HY816_19475 [Candidatus Wallbacteria bacterium]|nr:hypothetical protein [Candidatus Wallbacteria bacterium]
MPVQAATSTCCMWTAPDVEKSRTGEPASSVPARRGVACAGALQRRPSKRLYVPSRKWCASSLWMRKSVRSGGGAPTPVSIGSPGLEETTLGASGRGSAATGGAGRGSRRPDLASWLSCQLRASRDKSMSGSTSGSAR